jgi:ribosome-associated toxin RatA of RatAB toxin-antitoxin module
VANTIHRHAVVAYSSADMYALVSDIESYPRFLPWCTAAQILDYADNTVVARLSLSKGRVAQSFTTRNVLCPDNAIDMSLVDGPFRFLNGRWTFTPLHDAMSEVALDLNYEFKNKILALAVGTVFNQISNAMVDAFCERAHELYG